MLRTTLTEGTCDRSSSVAGFTLIELLVAFSLLSLIAVMSLGALNFGTRVWERSVTRGDAGHRLLLAQDLIRRQLGQAVARIRSQPNPASRLFQGDSDALSFVAPLPGSAAAGALYEQRLFLRADRLILSWQDRHGDERSRTPLNSGEAIVLRGVSDLRIAYLDPTDSNRGDLWLSSWRKPGLPPLVRLRLDAGSVTAKSAGEVWPELLVRLPLAKRARGIVDRFAVVEDRP